MKILEYDGLDTTHVKAQYRRAKEALSRDDFRSAEVKKLGNIGHGKFYRAKLDHTNRLLFSLVRHGDEVCALMLEVIEQHHYGRSRFLRGAAVDETKIADIAVSAARAEAQPVRYLHTERTAIHVLDKPISFDDAQEAVYRLPPPLIVVGSAGSGKTALTLEKLKHVDGEVLYVTQSPYLAQNARDLYYAHGFERENQEAVFLSYREFVESVRVPVGREAGWREFSGWFARLRQGQAFKDVDGHQAFEEIRGVIAARAGRVLSREEYCALGVRQSIFSAAERGRLYDLFEKYRAWLIEAKLYDLNLVAHEWMALAAPRYDFVVVDEVQDLTTAQLALVLKTLKASDRFLLCGDSNQIVHPNFFSWSQVKTLFWRDAALAERQELRVLTANFRNGSRTTRLANALLKIKHQRFGSIDRESNFLVQSVGGEPGTVALLPDKDTAKRELDRKIRQSTRFAVLVMRDEDKAQAREHFSTPLLFSVHEAKGLEYESIVLYRFVSDHRREFADVTEGVAREDLDAKTLDYRRARDKSDKSLEVYKFFVNALYVALTRAVKNLYLIESDTGHPLFGLLNLTAGVEDVQVQAKVSSLQDWQKEARKLELQGKQEQAENIRRTILRETAPPWPVLGETLLKETLHKVFTERVVGDKQKQRLYDYAAAYDLPMLAVWLANEVNYGPAQGFQRQRDTVARKYLAPYSAHHFKDVLRQCDECGLEHRTLTHLTPLMAASIAGNIALVDALLERGADPQATDDYGRNALHWAMLEAFRDPKFAQGPFAPIYERVAPSTIDVEAQERLVRIDKRLSEYFLFQTVWALFKRCLTRANRRPTAAFDTAAILKAWEHLPASVVRPERNKRQHLSSVLSRNEVERDYPYNRALFKRIAQGWYQFNPALQIRSRQGEAEDWRPVFSVLNLPLIKEFALPSYWGQIDDYLAVAGLPPCPADFGALRLAAVRKIEEREWQAEEARARAEAELWRREMRVSEEPPKWGTPEARRAALRNLRRQIDEARGQRENASDE